MSYEFAKKEIGDYRITVFQDEDAGCPCTDWDLAGVYFWDYQNYGYNRKLSRNCSSEVGAENAEDALKRLVCKYVSQKKIIDYINSENVDSFRMRYDKSEHMWYLENLYDGKWYNHKEFCPSDLKRFDDRKELCDILEEDDFASLLRSCKDIAFYEWSSCGYCQGDYASGYAYCDKERFKKMVDTRIPKTGESEPWTYSRERSMISVCGCGEMLRDTSLKRNVRSLNCTTTEIPLNPMTGSRLIHAGESTTKMLMTSSKRLSKSTAYSRKMQPNQGELARSSYY